MDENVIFEGQKTDNQPAQPQVPQPDSGGEGMPPSGTEPPVEDTDYESSEAPPPSGIVGLLKNSLVKKILIALGVIIILIIIIALIIPKQPRGKKVTLTWWGLWESSSIVQPVINDFEKQNPNIKIKYVKQDPDKYRDKLLTRINNGTGPDIFRYHNTWVPMITNILSPLSSDVITAKEFEANYYPVIQKDLTVKGGIYGIPLGIDSLALFINTDLLKVAGISVPQDWDQFAKAARTLTVKDQDGKKILTAGTALGTYGNIVHASDIISMMFLQQGVNLKKISEEKDDLIAAMIFYTSFAKGSNSAWNNSLDNSRLSFARGQLAMYFGFSWDIFTIDTLKTNNLKYEIYPVPGLVGGKNITVASYWVEGVSSRGKNQKEAMAFMHHLTKKGTLQKLYTEASKTRAFGEPYPRVDMADEIKDNKLIYPFISQLKNTESSYFSSDTHDGDTGLNKRVNTYLENAINAVVNNSSAETEIPKLQEGVGVILQQNGIQ